MLRMQVVADIDETFLPLPDDLLVNLEGSRAVVEAFLDSLPQMFAGKPHREFLESLIHHMLVSLLTSSLPSMLQALYA